jgi:hypothetical protein
MRGLSGGTETRRVRALVELRGIGVETTSNCDPGIRLSDFPSVKSATEAFLCYRTIGKTQILLENWRVRQDLNL